MTPQHPNMKLLLLLAGKIQSEGSDGEKATQHEAGKEGDCCAIGATIVNLQVGNLILMPSRIIVVFVSGFTV